jgi:hypothetical protein
MSILDKIIGRKTPPKQQRRRKTLQELSESIIMRKMREDPEYGLQIAERMRKLSRPEPEYYGEPPEEKSLLEQVRELREVRKALRELGGDENKTSLIRDIISVLPELPAVIQSFARQQPQYPPELMYEQYKQLTGDQHVPSRPAPSPEQPFTIQTHTEAPTEPEPAKPSVSDLAQLVDMTAEEAYEVLQLEHPEWIPALVKAGSYGGILSMLGKVDSPEAEALSHEDHKDWLVELQTLCKGGGMNNV